MIEIQDREKVAVHSDVAETIDALLRGDAVAPELRWRDEEGVHQSQGRPRPSPREQLGAERFAGLVGGGSPWRMEPGWRGDGSARTAGGYREAERGAFRPGYRPGASGGWRQTRGGSGRESAPRGTRIGGWRTPRPAGRAVRAAVGPTPRSSRRDRRSRSAGAWCWRTRSRARDPGARGARGRSARRRGATRRHAPSRRSRRRRGPRPSTSTTSISRRTTTSTTAARRRGGPPRARPCLVPGGSPLPTLAGPAAGHQPQAPGTGRPGSRVAGRHRPRRGRGGRRHDAQERVQAEDPDAP